MTSKILRAARRTPANSDTSRLSADTKRLLAREEGREVDFKRTPDSVKQDDLVALANSSGGTVLVGIAETLSDDGRQSGEVIGCNVSEKTKRGLINMAVNCKPSINVAVRRENTATRKPILRIEVPEGEMKPYCTGSGTYKLRADGQNVAIDPQLMRAMILQAEADEFVARFKAAGDAFIGELNAVHTDLTRQIEVVEAIAAEAAEAARDAQQAADDAAVLSMT